MNPTVSLNQRVLSHTAMHQTILFGQEYWHDNREGLGIYAPSEDETKFEDLDLLISQDHNGLNAGSFMIRKSLFSRVLMDVWRDPFLLQSQWPGQEQESLVGFSRLTLKLLNTDYTSLRCISLETTPLFGPT